MTTRERAYIADLKVLIDKGSLQPVQEYFQMILTDLSGTDFAWDYLYQTCYIHACLKHKTEIVEWMKTLFDLLPTITQIAMRQVFAYGNYLQRRHNPYLERVKN